MKTILAAPNLLKIEKISFCSHEVRLVVKTRLLKSTCPSCGWQSDKAHSRYQRGLADLPWEGIAVKLILSVRKFFCLNPDCRRQIFCERLPGLAAPYAHKTLRLNELLTRLGVALGGRPGARMAFEMGMKIGRDALLVRVRCAETAQSNTVRVLGVDDFAFRKGQSYGTILVDQERRRVVDLLPDREAATLANWLGGHSGIEIVTRDRASYYADGIKRGAPQAVQIADRWHLQKNLREALEDWFGNVEQSGISELVRFVKGLREDEAAVQAAMEYRWSNGQVEGQVNRLKMVKRQMFGRANLDLLKARVLNAA